MRPEPPRDLFPANDPPGETACLESATKVRRLHPKPTTLLECCSTTRTSPRWNESLVVDPTKKTLPNMDERVYGYVDDDCCYYMKRNKIRFSLDWLIVIATVVTGLVPGHYYEESV